MSRARRARREQQRAAASKLKAAAQRPSAAKDAAPAEAAVETQAPIPRAWAWLVAAFLLPNLGALFCGFVFDDRPLIVENEALHVQSFRQLAHIWTLPYWPQSRGQELYRPVSETLWALISAAGGGRHAALFHAAGLALGAAAVILLYEFLLVVTTPFRVAFVATMLFALFPIHTDATASVVGSAELLAAALGFAALIFYYRGRVIPALILFALAVFSKESAAGFAAVPLAFPRGAPRRRDSLLAACGAAATIGAALWVHHALSRSSAIPVIDNPIPLVAPWQRVLTALWVQCLYVAKTLAPVTLSADYSYKQIPLVMALGDWRAWAGLGLLTAAVALAWRWVEFRPAVLAYAILFSPTANILFPIGTIMGERLAYAPSLGIALLAAILLAQSRYWKHAVFAVALIFGARTAVRNLDWLNPERFYTRLAETSPNSAKSHYSMGVLRSWKEDDLGAIEEYDRAIAIFPAYAEAFRNRGNALARLGRREEAMASYRQCLRFDPHDFASLYNLQQLQAGIAVNPPRGHL
jgi:protein O-mannosyl-transferase